MRLKQIVNIMLALTMLAGLGGTARAQSGYTQITGVNLGPTTTKVTPGTAACVHHASNGVCDLYSGKATFPLTLAALAPNGGGRIQSECSFSKVDWTWYSVEPTPFYVGAYGGIAPDSSSTNSDPNLEGSPCATWWTLPIEYPNDLALWTTAGWAPNYNNLPYPSGYDIDGMGVFETQITTSGGFAPYGSQIALNAKILSNYVDDSDDQSPSPCIYVPRSGSQYAASLGFSYNNGNPYLYTFAFSYASNNTPPPGCPEIPVD
jgi:hypothetical protein